MPMKLHPDDMRFFSLLVEAITIAVSGMWEPEYRAQVAQGFLLEARNAIKKREREIKDEITP